MNTYQNCIPSMEYPENCIDDFEFYNLLGNGGFAKVYRARSKVTGQEVAVKIIEKSKMRKNGLVNRVRREVEIHSRLKHPSILELYTCFEDTDSVYLILEICHNDDLQTHVMRNGPLHEDVARHYLKQIIHGLLYLHSYNIVHRDLTLSNLLLTKDMRVKIADFGLATRIEPGHEHKTMCGTPNYISPEVVSHETQSLETDVWSIGCMLYTMLIGKAPFDTKEIRATLDKVIACDYNLPRDLLSPEATDLICCLLKKQPQDRIKLSAILTHAFIQKRGGFSVPRKMDHSSDSGIDSISRLTAPNSCSSGHNIQQIGEAKLPLIENSYKASVCPQFIQEPRSGAGESLAKRRPPSIGSTPLAPAQSSTTLSGNTFVPKPLNARRLRPTRRRVKQGFINILEDESVCVEFIHSSPTSSPRIYLVMTIDSSGRSILIYHPKANEGGVPISSSSTSEEANSISTGKPIAACCEDSYLIYELDNLPVKYWKKYAFIAKFIGMLRAHTPKLTLYTPEAKCMLMENGNAVESDEGDFEVEFYPLNQTQSPPLPVLLVHWQSKCNGGQIKIQPGPNSSSSGQCSTSNNKSAIILDSGAEQLWSTCEMLLVPQHRRYLHLANKYREQCINLEKVMQSSVTEDECEDVFPCVIGRNRCGVQNMKPSNRQQIVGNTNSLSPCMAELVKEAGVKVLIDSNPQNSVRSPRLPSGGVNSCPIKPEFENQISNYSSLTKPKRSSSHNRELINMPLSTIPLPTSIALLSNAEVPPPRSQSITTMPTFNKTTNRDGPLAHSTPQRVTPIYSNIPGSSSRKLPVFVPGIGWASQPNPDQLSVQFNDGAILDLHFDTQLVRLIKYKPSSDDQFDWISTGGVLQEDGFLEFIRLEKLPPKLQNRLALIPQVVKHLKSTALFGKKLEP